MSRTATLPPGADAVERGADDTPQRMGCAVPRMHRPQSARRPADAPVQGVARSHGKPAASGRISAPSDGREWMSRSGYNIAEQIEILSLHRPAICHLGPGGQCVVCRALQTCNVGPGGGGPPRRGVASRRLARLVPRSGGGHNPHPLASAALPHEASAVGGRRRKAPPFSRAVRPPFGASAACAVAGGWFPRRPVAARPLAARAAVLPCCLLLPSRACLPPRRGPAVVPLFGAWFSRWVPPLWRWAALRPWDGGGRPSPAPALCCARPGSPPGAWFFSPPPRGFCGSRRPGSVFLLRVLCAAWGQGAKIQKMVQNQAKNRENRRK